jgi:hypothetical protein
MIDLGHVSEETKGAPPIPELEPNGAFPRPEVG